MSARPGARPARTRPGSAGTAPAYPDARKVLRLLARLLQPHGFEHAKTAFFVRQDRHVLEFVHAHKHSFEPSFRLHFGLRVRSDDFAGAHLNGPCSDEIGDPSDPRLKRYRFGFGADEAGRQACAQQMLDCTVDAGLPWFSATNDPAVLLSAASPLTAAAQAALRRELADPAGAQASAATQRLLGVQGAWVPPVATMSKPSSGR